MVRNPTAEQSKQVRLAARLSPTQKALLEQAAAIRGLTLTEFVVTSAQAAAEEVLRERVIIELTARDTAVLVEALLNPPPLNEAFLEDLRLHREMVESRP